MSMTKEQLREKARLTPQEMQQYVDLVRQRGSRVSYNAPGHKYGYKQAIIDATKAQHDKDFKVIQQYIDEQNIKQVVEGELPEYDFKYSPTFFESGYNIAQQDMLKWHEEALKPVVIVE